MPETSNELPELPQWVQDLIEAAEERGYERGRDDGRRRLYYDIKRAVEGLEPYGA